MGEMTVLYQVLRLYTYLEEMMVLVKLFVHRKYHKVDLHLVTRPLLFLHRLHNLIWHLQLVE